MAFFRREKETPRPIVDDDDDDTSGDEISASAPTPPTRPGPVPVVPAQRRNSGTGGGGGAAGGGGGATKLPIQIRTMDGKTYKIDAKTDWDVERLKQEFVRWHGENAAMCSLYYKAKKLQDNNTLLSYKIGAGDFVMANFRSVGGVEE